MSVATTISPDRRSDDQINTYGSFDEWLEAFADDDNTSNVVATNSDEMNASVGTSRPPPPKYRPLSHDTTDSENASWKVKSSSKVVYFAVNGLNGSSFRQRRPASTNVEIRHDDFVYKIIQKLHDQGKSDCIFHSCRHVLIPQSRLYQCLWLSSWRCCHQSLGLVGIGPFRTCCHRPVMLFPLTRPGN